MGLRRSPVGKHAAGGACSGGGAGRRAGTRGAAPGGARAAALGGSGCRAGRGAGGGAGRSGARRHRGAARRSRYGRGAAGLGSAGPAAGRVSSSRPLLSHAPSSVPRLLAASGGRGSRGRRRLGGAPVGAGWVWGGCSCVAAPQCAEPGRAVRSRARSAVRGRPPPTPAAKAFVRNYLGVIGGGRKGQERSAGVHSRAVRSSGRL